MTAVRRIGFAYNPTIEAALELRERAAGWVETRGLEHWAATAADTAALREQLPGTDILVVLGGDGTFLRAAQAVIAVDVPILGLNVGKVGFLSKVEAEGLERVLGQLVGGDYVLENRMALECRIHRGGQRGASGGMSSPSGAEPARRVALNDFVIARGSLARVVRLATSIDESHLATFVADGLVVASPTGSTGYSFSAGGPILDPTARNILVTPIAGYLSTIRSVVVRPIAIVRCRVLDAHEALVSVDGHDDIPIEVGDVIEVRAIERPVRLVEPSGSLPFWDLVRQKVELLPS
jgi:NAD+ kinase